MKTPPSVNFTFKGIFNMFQQKSAPPLKFIFKGILRSLGFRVLGFYLGFTVGFKVRVDVVDVVVVDDDDDDVTFNAQVAKLCVPRWKPPWS